MALIKTVPPSEAEGSVKEAYSVFENMGIEPPLPFQMMSASPGIMSLQAGMTHYFIDHPTLEFPLLAHIRLLVAHEENYPFCVGFNQGLLKNLAGLKEDQIETIKADPERAALDPKNKAMLLFVLKAVRDPAATEQRDVDALHELGWTDSDIFDAVQQGMMMIVTGMSLQAFKMGEK